MVGCGHDSDQVRITNAPVRVMMVLEHIDEGRKEIPGLANPTAHLAVVHAKKILFGFQRTTSAPV
jgi:hypothetical protein